MRHLQSKEKSILALSVLIFTWMFLVFFVDYSRHYQYAQDRFSFITMNSQTDLEIIKIRNAYAFRCGEFRCFTGAQFVDLYNQIDSERLKVQEVPLTFDDPLVNTYVNNFAQGIGYALRSFADESRLVNLNGFRTLPEVRNAYNALKNEMLKEGIALHFVSGYRDLESQKDIFLSKLQVENNQDILTGMHDDALAKILERSALPGYSKHHSGYAVDFGCGNDYLVFEFAQTDCYTWMSENNFEPIKKYGFIPSYPEDVIYQGPNPEPWEYVWVGVDQLR